MSEHNATPNRQKRNRRLRFRLRTLLLAMLVASLLAKDYRRIHDARTQSELAATLAGQHVNVTERTFISPMNWLINREFACVIPDRVEVTNYWSRVVDLDTLIQLKGLRELKLIGIGFTTVSGETLNRISLLKHLQLLEIDNTSVSDEDIAAFQRAVPRCIVRRGHLDRARKAWLAWQPMIGTVEFTQSRGMLYSHFQAIATPTARWSHQHIHRAHHSRRGWGQIDVGKSWQRGKSIEFRQISRQLFQGQMFSSEFGRRLQRREHFGEANLFFGSGLKWYMETFLSHNLVDLGLTEVIRGQTCQVFEASGLLGRFRIWCDPSKEYAICKITYRGEQQGFGTVEIEWQRHAEVGWIPIRWSADSYEYELIHYSPNINYAPHQLLVEPDADSTPPRDVSLSG